MKKPVKSEYIYLDVCALCRPFDDQRYMRIHLECEAVNMILNKIRLKKIKLAVSPVHYREIGDIPDPFERYNIMSLFNNYGESIKFNIKSTRQRAEHHFSAGFGVADAAHLAFAEAVNADFVTCDDRLLKNA